MKVYIVTSGNYSDYYIERVFSTREKAQEYLDHRGNAERANIEEYNLDEETPRGVFGYIVLFYLGTGEAETSLVQLSNNSYTRKDSVSYHESSGSKTMRFILEAKDSVHAVKIASERLMQIRAMPHLFPLIDKKCVRDTSGWKTYPVYDYHTRQIILDKHDTLVDSYKNSI